MVLVDVTVFFLITMGYHKDFYSYKFKKSDLFYEVAMCIETGDICWCSGPYAPGVWNDGSIFKDGLMMYLEPGERVETDRGYHGSAPKYVKCPDGLLADPDPAVKAMSARARSQQETVNEWFKNWEILCTPYCHDFLEHQTVFWAIAVLTQLSFAMNPLFPVEYNDEKMDDCIFSQFVLFAL